MCDHNNNNINREIHFSVSDVTKEAITRFGEKLGHKLRVIHIYRYEDESSLENQQLLFDLCPNITSIKCRHFLSLNIIASKHLKKLILIHYDFWSDTEIQAFVRFVDTNDNKLIHLVIDTEMDTNIYVHLDDIFKHVCRMTNLKVFRFLDVSEEFTPIQVQAFKHLVPVCKKLKKVSLCVTLMFWIFGKYSVISMHLKN